MNRRQILLGSGLVALGGAVSGVLALHAHGAKADSAIQLAQATKIYDDDRFMGESAAPITIVEFSSLTCPHCASFHKHTLPELKAAWFDSGKARMIYRHYPRDGLALRAAALADCFEGKRFFGFLDLLCRTRELPAVSVLDPTPGIPGEPRAVCAPRQEVADGIVHHGAGFCAWE